MAQKKTFTNGLVALVVVVVAAVLVTNIQPGANVPDFKNMASVADKKRTFFDYFKVLADDENKRILSVRAELESGPSQSTLEKLAKKYRTEVSDPASDKEIATLLERVDVVPTSLVLAQAAIESAWGTSRFARDGYNYFGQWCFTKGCGIVPSNRSDGASHEVRTFDSPKDSVKAYMHNLNSHPTYDMVRTLRREAREADKPIHGCVLAAGLSKYSERGQGYIEEIRQLIRVNDLTPNGKGPCGSSVAPEAPAS